MMFNAGDLLFPRRSDTTIYTCALRLRERASDFFVTYVAAHPRNPNYSYVLYRGSLVAVYDSDPVVIR